MRDKCWDQPWHVSAHHAFCFVSRHKLWLLKEGNAEGTNLRADCVIVLYPSRCEINIFLRNDTSKRKTCLSPV